MTYASIEWSRELGDFFPDAEMWWVFCADWWVGYADSKGEVRYGISPMVDKSLVEACCKMISHLRREGYYKG